MSLTKHPKESFLFITITHIGEWKCSNQFVLWIVRKTAENRFNGVSSIPQRRFPQLLPDNVLQRITRYKTQLKESYMIN